MSHRARFASLLLAVATFAASRHTAGADCGALPDHATLRQALAGVVKEGPAANGGLGNQMWAALVDREGLVCAVAFSGPGPRRAVAGCSWRTASLLADRDFLTTLLAGG